MSDVEELTQVLRDTEMLSLPKKDLSYVAKLILASGGWRRLVSERDRLEASNEAAWKRVATAEAALLELEHRPLHLVVRNGEWVDDRCGCAYHPDDDNNTHRGGPHVHECAEHQEPQEAKL